MLYLSGLGGREKASKTGTQLRSTTATASFTGRRRTSRQLSTAKPMVVDADPMTRLAIRKQPMGGSVPMCLSVIALFSPLSEICPYIHGSGAGPESRLNPLRRLPLPMLACGHDSYCTS
jgi:hypothetical protein